MDAPLYRLLAAIPLLIPFSVAAQEPVAPTQRITPEMKARTETIAQALEGLAPDGFAKKGPVERYTEANLFEKINGRSELVQSYDVTGMTFVTFSKAADPSRFLDVYLYDMTTPLGAFGLFSVERPPGRKAISVGDGGYRTDADTFFRKGQYYVTVLTSGPDEGVQKAASALAIALANRLKGKPADLWGLAILPAQNRIDDSIQYLMNDALGLDFLTDVFTARYRLGEAEFLAFVSRCKSAENAAMVLAKHKAHLAEFGGMAQQATIEGVAITLADMGGGSFDAVGQVGDVTVGVTEVKGREAAVKAMTFLLKGLKTRK